MDMTITDWIQAISTLVLVGVTAFYAWKTHNLSKATEKQVNASVKMAEEMAQTRYDTVRPVIDIQLGTSANDYIERGLAHKATTHPKGLNCILANIGLGPALDVHSHMIIGIATPKPEELDYNFGVIAVGEPEKQLCQAVHEKEGVMYFDVQYRDVFGRLFESKRELVEEKGNWTLGPLRTSVMENGAKQND